MKNLLLIPIFSMTAYLLFIYLKYGKHKSISISYADLKTHEKPFFTLNLIFVAIPIMIVGIESTQNHLAEGLFFLAGFLITLIGASPAFWTNRMEHTAHMIGSYGGISLGMIACFVAGFPVLTLIPIFLFAGFTLIQFFVKKWQLWNYIYWIEVSALLAVVLTLLINLLK